jgi:hypothetical protein
VNALDGVEIYQLVLVSFFTGIGVSFGTELSKYLIGRMKENALMKRLKG